MQKIFILVFPLFFLLAISSILGYYQKKETFEVRREQVLGDLSSAIDDAVKDGEYGCCIDPACTMCYLGSWIWDDGVCRCDEMIATGQDDKVCPQCVKGMEKGLCKSSLGECQI
jgi:hypothetical protein